MLVTLLVAVGAFSSAAASSSVAEATPAPPAALFASANNVVPEPEQQPTAQATSKRTIPLYFAGSAALPVALDPLVATPAVWRNSVDSLEMAMRLTAGGFPDLPEDSGEGRRIVYSNSQQRIWLVGADGFVLDSYLVSGRKNTPRPSTYQVFSKSKLAYSHHGITMRNMVRFAWGKNLAIGFHEIPRYASGRPLQSEEQLGTYRSAGCVRQDAEDALRLYLWADIGTTVVVTP